MKKTYTEIITYESEDESLAVKVTRNSGYKKATITVSKDKESECVYKYMTFNENEIRMLAEVFNNIIKECLV